MDFGEAYARAKKGGIVRRRCIDINGTCRYTMLSSDKKGVRCEWNILLECDTWLGPWKRGNLDNDDLNATNWEFVE